MANDILRFAGTQIGDQCLGVSVEVSRGQGGGVETAAMRQYAILDDPSPNIHYILRAVVKKNCTGAAELVRWANAMGALMLLGKRTVTITGANDVTLEDAILVGPVAIPLTLDKHPGKVLDMEFTFISVTPPK